jgi:hypothetical protein
MVRMLVMMRHLPRLVIFGILAALAQPAIAQSLLEENGVAFDAETVGTVERTFNVTVAGTHELRLRDLATPAALFGVRAAIIRGTSVLATVALANGSAGPAVTRVDLAAGSYLVRVVGTPNPANRAGSVSIEVERVGDSAPVLQFNDAVSLAPPAVPDNARILERSFTVADNSVHTLILTDLGFPTVAQGISLLLTRGSTIVGGPLAAPGSFTFVGQPASVGDPPYLLRVVLTANATAAGALAHIRVRSASGGVVLDESVTAGRVRPVIAATLGAGNHTLRLTDLGLPTALSAARVIGIREGVEAVRGDSSSPAAFDATPGAHRFFVYARPGTEPGSGALALEVLQGATPVAAAAEAINVGSTATRVFSYPVSIAAPGTYTLRLSDFQFPNALAAVTAVGTQGGTPLGTLIATGTVSLANVRAGQLFVLAAARAGGVSGGSLFGLEILPTGSGPALFDVTQGIGALFRARRFEVTTAGRYDVAVRDLEFPANFIELYAVVTRGPNRIGSIFTGGTFSFDATPGGHTVNFIARPDLTFASGSYAISVAPSPPPPSVTLTASATAVVSGGTATLTWSSQNATACTASGGWSGSRPPTGSETTAPITAATTYTLTCTGGGGSASATASVSVAPPTTAGGSGGGGAADLYLLAALLALLIASRSCRRVDAGHGPSVM